jgi:KaiC/GvpD/RAD55 family RecA-like ATPase
MPETIASTGIKRLDEVLLEGIPAGFTILVESDPAAGMELFAKQFAAGSAKGEKVVYFTTAESASEVKAVMRKFGWAVPMKIHSVATEYYKKVLMKEIERGKVKREGITSHGIQPIRPSRTFAESAAEVGEVNFVEDLVYEICKVRVARRVIIDSLDFFLEQYPAKDVLTAIRSIVAHLKYTKSVGLFTLTKGICEKNVQNSIWSIVDCVLDLEVERMGTSFESRIVLRKVRNMPEKLIVLIYSVTPEGITPEMVTRIG